MFKDAWWLLYGWVCKLARWSKSGVLNIGHLSGQDGCVLPSLGFPCLSSKKKLSFWLVINPHFAKLVRSRWLDIGIALFCLYYWNYFFTFIKKQKRTCKIIASNTCIQPLWPHVWSITHTYRIDWASTLACLQSFSFVPGYLMSNSIKTYTVIYL